MHRGLEAAASKYPEVPAVLAGDDAWTFADLQRASNAAAAQLALFGVGPGTRVALMTSNRPEFVVAVHAVSKLGAASVLLNPSWKALEVDGALDLTEPVCAVADGEGAQLLASRLGREGARPRRRGDPIRPSLRPRQQSTSTRDRTVRWGRGGSGLQFGDDGPA